MVELGAEVHQDDLARPDAAGVLVVVEDAGIGPRADDGRVSGAPGPALEDDGHGRGLELVFEDAGAGRQHGLADAFGREPAVPPEDLDLAGRLDRPQGVDGRGDIAEFHLGIALPQLDDAVAVGRELVVVMAAGAAPFHQAGLGAGLVKAVPLREPQVEHAAGPGRPAGQELVEIARGVDVRVAALGFGLGVVEEVGPVVLLLPGRQLRQEKVGALGRRHEDKDGAEVVAAREIEEVVVLAEVGPGGRRGVAEEDDGPALDPVHERGAPLRELVGAVAGPLGQEHGPGERGQEGGGEGETQTCGSHQAFPSTMARRAIRT